MIIKNVYRGHALRITVGITVLIMLISSIGAAATAPQEEWNKTYGGINFDDAYSMQQTSDGGYILAGRTGAGSGDAWIIKTDSFGNEQWNKTFGGINAEKALSVQQNLDGGYILAGYTVSSGAGSYDAWLIKTDSYGNEQWNKTLGGINIEMAYSVQQISDGGSILAGDTQSFGAGDYDAWLVKTDLSGNEQWNKTFGGINADYALSFQQNLDGGYILAGYTASYGAGGNDAWLIKTDSYGNEQWNKTFGGINTDQANSIQKTPDGGYILSGRTASFGAGSIDAWLIKTDSYGNEQWNKTFGGINIDHADSVKPTSDGGYILAGRTTSYGAGNYDAWLVKISNKTESLPMNLQLSKEAPVSMDFGNPMTYTLYYNNLGDTATSGVILEDTLPSNVEFVSASDGGTYDPDTRNVTWNIDSVAAFPEGYGSRTILVEIPGSVSSGTVIQNTASISTTDPESRYDDNSATATTIVTGPTLPANVSIEPTIGNTGGTPLIYWRNPVNFSYNSPCATSVDINIHLSDDGLDITGHMTESVLDRWTYNTAFYPRHDIGTVIYTIVGCEETTIGFNIEVTEPQEEWNRTFGENNSFQARSVKQTLDGGYILAGFTNSVAVGNMDAWLIKTDSYGIEQWNKTFGGIDNEEVWSVQQTLDGGYILAGYTRSYGVGGNDAWFIKTDSSGNEQWNKTFGGINNDRAWSVQKTQDGGYILSCDTQSFGAGGTDAWLIKTDSSGNEQWNKTIGGIGSERGYFVRKTLDGGYILTGFTQSYGAGGTDAWLVKTDSSGNEQWNSTFGGNKSEYVHSAQQTLDGGYILGGFTQSFGVGGSDMWLVKTDSSGNEEWNKTFGGNKSEMAYFVQQISDGGYILGGFTQSFGAGGSDTDAWLIMTDSSGNEQWNKTSGGIYSNDVMSGQPTSDGGFIFAGSNYSNATGKLGAWLVKFSNIIEKLPANLLLSKEAPISMDYGNPMTYTLNYNNLGDTTATGVILEDTLPSNVEFVSASDGGIYDSVTRNVTWNIDSVSAFPDGYGARTVTVQIPTSVPVDTVIENTATINTTGPESDYSDNSANATTTVTDASLANLQVSKTGPISMDYGNPMTYTIYYSNSGDITVSGVILVDTLPVDVGFLSASDGGSYDPATRNVTWNIDTVGAYPDGYGARTVTVEIPTSVPIGTVIQNTALISTLYPESGYNDNSATFSTTVTGPILPPNVSLEPVSGYTGSAPSIHWTSPETFSFNSSCATGVSINIHLSDGGSDITDPMTESAVSTWTYNIAFYPRHGSATVTYIITGCEEATVNFNIYIDPAGYIYDAATGARISGANVWLEQPDGEGGWRNVLLGQTPSIMQPDVNPLTTNPEGQYQWDVLTGIYRVHVEAPGYYPADSIEVSIPPPVTDLHVGLIHKIPPGVTNLINTTYAQTYINWTWTDPQDPDFTEVMVYLDGVYKDDVLKGIQYYNASVAPGTYTIGTRTVDIIGNINATMVTHTATTILPSIRFINGTVKDNSTGNSLAGVTVSANSTLSTTTNATGFYSFSVTDGSYDLKAIFDIRYYTNTTTVSTVGKAFVVQDIEMVKKPTGNITGTVKRCCTIG